ncbi:MAG: S-adenosylmethionine:tRNA ribosyltransferase-isomerase [Aureispira sp.]|nr:S-adenosylmethionine:tRNA ribosyltransferase-isomerase [Aureispira sp.]
MNTTSIYPTPKILEFDLPKHLQCSKPTEERGIARDEVKLMISQTSNNHIDHDIFRNIGDYLQEGDVLVVNTSGTLKAALETEYTDGTVLRVHLSTRKAYQHWIIELREVVENGTHRFTKARKGDQLPLATGFLQLLEPYYDDTTNDHLQLWVAKFNIPIAVEDYLDQYGKPIRYNYIKDLYPQSYYQTVFANEMGSAEMPSAGRAFTPELVTQLVSKGIQIIPILLHTGVASLEANERPYSEYYKISQHSAAQLNLAKQQNKRIVAVGTTVVRTLETKFDISSNQFRYGEGWTDIFITPQRGIHSINGLLTGMHEPKASHLYMLEALANREHLALCYQEAIEQEYLWHEFGDLHLILA